MIDVVMRLTSARRSRSTLYGQVRVCWSAVSRKYSTMMSTASRLATSPEAWPPIPSATIASRTSVGRWIESSLWSRFRPMLVAPEKRTRLASRG